MRVLFNTAGISKSAAQTGRKYSAPDVNVHNHAENRNNIDFELLRTNYSIFNLNFNARIKPKKFTLIEYRGEISCPCCGEKMKDFKTQEAESIAKEIASKKGDELAQALYSNMKVISSFKKKTCCRNSKICFK